MEMMRVESSLNLSHSPAALPGTRRVSARQGRAGEKSGLFEHPAGAFRCCVKPTILFPFERGAVQGVCRWTV